jgi:hypothetical protein
MEKCVGDRAREEWKLVKNTANSRLRLPLRVFRGVFFRHNPI